MNPTESYSFEGNIAVLLEMAGQADRYDKIGAALANKRKVPLGEFQAFVFSNLDKLAAFVDDEVKKFGRPLTADEFNDVIKRGVDEYEKEVLSS
jgi:hypothetical protein